MSRPYGVLIIGCGDMGQQHANAWRQEEHASIVGVLDPDSTRAETLSREFKCKAFSDLQTALQHPEVHIVSVGTPVCFHSRYAIAAAQAGKHIICEKPIALNLQQATQMQQAAEEADVILLISYQYRGIEKYKRIKTYFDDGSIEGPSFLRFADLREVRPKIAMHRKSMNGGPIIDMAGHFFDLMHFFTGAEPVSVFASGHTFSGSRKRVAGIDDLAIDAAEILVKYTGGHTLSAHIHWSRPEGAKTHRREEIFTNDRVIDFTSYEQIRMDDGVTTEIIDLDKTNPGPRYTINAMLQALQGDRSDCVTPDDGTRALRTSLAVLESIETGACVTL